MVCQCGGTGKGIKSKVGGELELCLQALFTYLCDLCAFKCAISSLIFNISPLIFNTKCLFLWYCEGTKAYWFMCVQSKKIINCRDVEFMEDSTSVGNDLEMRPSGRNDTPNVVIVDTSSKSPCVDDDAKEDPSNEEATPTLGCSSTPSTPSKDASTSGEQEGQPWEEHRYPLRERRLLGEWWKNHILTQQDVERANVAYLDVLEILFVSNSQC